MKNTKVYNASITAFAALVFMLIAALLLTLVETARQSAARAFLSSLTGTAIESLFADYYAPLFEEYHIFGLNTAYYTGTPDDQYLSDKMCEYIDYSLEANEEGALALFNARRLENTLSEQVLLTDDDCSKIASQAVAYEKMDTAGDLIDELLEYFNIFEGNKKKGKLIEKKLDTEEALASLDSDIVELMGRIDGIAFDDTGVTYSSDGSIATREDFVKQLCIQPVSMTSVKINHSALYAAVSEKCIYIIPHIDTLRSSGEEAASLYKTMQSCKAELDRLEAELAQEVGDSQKLGYLQNEIGRAEAAYSIALSELEAKREIYRVAYGKLYEAHRGAEAAVKEALEVIVRIEEKQPELISSVLELEDMLSDFSQDAQEQDEDLLGELGSTIEQMKGYVGIGSESITDIDIARIRQTLENNSAVLQEAGKNLSTLEAGAETATEVWRVKLEASAGAYARYSFDGLNFDYSQLKLTTVEDEISEALEDLAADALLSLLFTDSTKLSDGELTADDLVSAKDEFEAQESDENDFLSGTKGTDTIKGAMADDVWGLFSGVIDKVFLARYVQGHFLNLTQYGELTQNGSSLNSQGTGAFKGHVLSYEQEYILCGGSGDRINLERTALRLLLVRFVGSLIYCLSHSNVTGQAAAFAASVVGFTGLPFLVSILKYIVIIVWALVQALVEVSAIMNGKKISLLTNETLFCVELAEIPFAFGGLIASKAESMKETKGAPDYDMYVLLFLILQSTDTQSVRMADLIQENVRDKYDASFCLTNCLYSVASHTEYELPYRFAGGGVFEPVKYIVNKHISYQ